MPQQPNILFILTDQLRAFSLGCYGDTFVSTPHIDKLASEGCRFEHVVSNCPLCAPARSCCLTGQYARTCAGDANNVWDEPPVRIRRRLIDMTLAESLHSAGYHTRLVGKWHVDPDPLQVGFEQALWPYIQHLLDNQWFYSIKNPSESRQAFQVSDQLAPDFECDEVCRFLSGRHDQPFFLYYNISPPHMPCMGMPPQYWDMYKPAITPLRSNVQLHAEDAEWWYKTYLWGHRFCVDEEPHTLNLPEGFGLHELTALYYGLITWVDDLVGRVMASLRSNGLIDNTIVLFGSDHGDNLGSHGFFNKDRLYEEAIRVPMIIQWLGHIPPHVNQHHQAQLIDIMPTLLDLAGCEIPPSVQGRSLAPLLYGRSVLNDNLVFIETPRNQIGVCTTTHKYGMQLRDDYSISDELCFYDLITDPYEERNLIKTDEQQDKARELHDILLAWHQATPRLIVNESTKSS